MEGTDKNSLLILVEKLSHPLAVMTAMVAFRRLTTGDDGRATDGKYPEEEGSRGWLAIGLRIGLLLVKVCFDNVPAIDWAYEEKVSDALGLGKKH